jgi:hypothetical protein
MAVNPYDVEIINEDYLLNEMGKKRVIEEVIYLRVFSIISAIRAHFGRGRISEAEDIIKGFYDNFPTFLRQRVTSMAHEENIIRSNLEVRFNHYADVLGSPESQNAEGLGSVFADLCGRGNSVEYENVGANISKITVALTEQLLNKYIEGKPA